MKVGLVLLATLDPATLHVTARADANCHTALDVLFGFRSRTLIVVLVSFLCAIVLLAICLWLVVVVLSQ